MHMDICRITTLTAVIAVVIFATTASAAEWESFTTEDGLADNTVTSILEDSEGNLWFGTLGGVSRYDGTWTTYTIEDGLADDLVLTILEDQDGNLWFGTREGVSRYDGQSWRTFTTEDGVPDNIVNAILEDREGNMWFGTREGVSRYDGERWTTYTTADGLAHNEVHSILEDSEGNLWFGTRRGASRYDGETWNRDTINGHLANDVQAILEDRDDNFWFATSGGGVSRYDGETWTTYDKENGLVNDRVSAILEDSEGNLWFGHSLDVRSGTGGITRYNGQRWTTYTTDDGLADNWVRAILEDSEGNLWFGTNGGASRYDATWTTYTIEDGLGHNQVWTILEDSRENLWFGTRESGVSRYDGKIWTTFTTADGLAGNWIRTIYEDREGNLWFGTREGVSRYDGQSWKTYTRDSTNGGLALDIVNAILEDTAGNLWFGTEMRGVSRYDGTTWITYTEDDGLAHNRVNEILKDSEGNLWFGTSEGVSRYDGEIWKTYGEIDGLVNNSVMVIMEDRESNLWFGTGSGRIDGGISHYDGETWTTYTREDGLANDFVNAIMEDSGGNLWFGTQAGLSRFDGERWITYSAADGLADSRVNAILEDSDGHLWFGTGGGVTRYRVERTPPNTFILDGPGEIIGVPQAFFEYNGGDRYSPDEDVQFGHAIKNDQDKPIQADWSSFTDHTSTLTDPLPNGTYTFYVRGRDEVGNIDLSPAKRSFTVELTPPIVAISSPSSNEITHGNVNIRGSAFDNSDIPNFGSYTLEYGKGSDEDKISEWLSIRDRAVKPVVNDLLGMWDTEGLFGTYVLRLSAVDGFDHRSKYAITVHVVAAAVEVDHSSGGHITDSASNVDLYIPPNGIPKSTQVTITPIALEGVAKPSALNLHLTGMAYDIGPKDLAVLKPVTFTMSLDKVEIAEVPDLDKLAIFTRSSSDNPWERVGGTVDERTGKMIVALTHFGRFAVMEDLSEEEGKLSISDVNCQPRVFSPEGGAYDTKTTLSFNLGRRSEVTVKVYDVSGRFKRRLLKDRTMNRGSNAVVWDGRDHHGKVVVNALYVVAVEANGKVETKTVVVLNK